MTQVFQEIQKEVMLKNFTNSILKDIITESSPKQRKEKTQKLFYRRDLACAIYPMLNNLFFIKEVLSYNSSKTDREIIIETLENKLFAEFVVANSFARRVSKGFVNMTDPQKEHFIIMIKLFYENFIE